MTLGNRWSEDQVNEFMKDLNPKADERINYIDVTKKLMKRWVNKNALDNRCCVSSKKIYHKRFDLNNYYCPYPFEGMKVGGEGTSNKLDKKSWCMCACAFMAGYFSDKLRSSLIFQAHFIVGNLKRRVSGSWLSISYFEVAVVKVCTADFHLRMQYHWRCLMKVLTFVWTSNQQGFRLLEGTDSLIYCCHWWESVEMG